MLKDHRFRASAIDAVRRSAVVPALCLLTGLVLAACRSKPERPNPVLVLGVDGADFRVIEQFWNEGRMPALKSLVDKGAAARLRTGYNAKSPIIWTTFATGVGPDRHGITDFVVHGEHGDVVASSDARKVPALWNMTTSAGLRAVVLGWWATWPAEPINGVIITDRAVFDLPRRVWPEDWAPEFKRLLDRSRTEPNAFPRSFPPDNDSVVALAARELVARDFDLTLVYIRNIDFVSHNFWKFFRSEKFEGIDPVELRKYRDFVPRSYQAADDLLADLLRRVRPNTNVFVISDHGFYGLAREKTSVVLDLDPIFEKLGLLVMAEGGVDKRKSKLYTHASPRYWEQKRVRFSLAGRDPEGTVAAGEVPALRRALEEGLARFRYAGGASMFAVGDPDPAQATSGADLVVKVLAEGATEGLLFDGRPLNGIAAHLRRISGSHGNNTHGIFVAAGPDIERGASPEGIHIHDVTPTLLYALGLPVAADFAGKPRTDVFTPEFRAAHPVRTIATWGERETGPAASAASPVDEQIKEQLKALGYMN